MIEFQLLHNVLNVIEKKSNTVNDATIKAKGSMHLPKFSVKLLVKLLENNYNCF